MEMVDKQTESVTPMSKNPKGIILALDFDDVLNISSYVIFEEIMTTIYEEECKRGYQKRDVFGHHELDTDILGDPIFYYDRACTQRIINASESKLTRLKKIEDLVIGEDSEFISQEKKLIFKKRDEILETDKYQACLNYDKIINENTMYKGVERIVRLWIAMNEPWLDKVIIVSHYNSESENAVKKELIARIFGCEYYPVKFHQEEFNPNRKSAPAHQKKMAALKEKYGFTDEMLKRLVLVDNSTSNVIDAINSNAFGLVFNTPEVGVTAHKICGNRPLITKYASVNTLLSGELMHAIYKILEERRASLSREREIIINKLKNNEYETENARTEAVNQKCELDQRIHDIIEIGLQMSCSKCVNFARRPVQDEKGKTR